MFETSSLASPARVEDPPAGPPAWAPTQGWDDLDDVTAEQDPLGDGWGLAHLTAADAPSREGRAAFTITYGTGLEDPGVLDALLAAAGGSGRSSRDSGAAAVAAAARIASVQARLGQQAGGVLASAVQDACDPGTGLVADLSVDAVVALVAAGQRLAGYAVGAQLVGAAELVRRYEATTLLGEAEAVAELALETGLSSYAMQQRVYAAQVLAVRFPAVYAALTSGALEWAKAWAILDKAANLPSACDGAYEASALAYALTHNQPQLWTHLALLVQQLDPEGAAERAKAAHARRGVRVTPGEDSTATLALTAGATAIASAEAALNLLTEAALADRNGSPSTVTVPDTGLPEAGFGDTSRRVGDDGRQASTTRADVLLDLIENAAAALTNTEADHTDIDSDAADRPDTDAAGARPAGRGRSRKPPSRGHRRQRRRRTQVNVTMALSTVLGLNEEPALLDGYGPIPAGMAREVVASGTWRCVVTDDRPGQVHGTLLGLGRGTFTPAYTPTDRAWEFIVDRDGMCSFPGCRRDAARSDIDHRVPWPAGDTCDCNLEALCGQHHRLKHESRFRVRRDDTGAWIWTTPNGRTFDRGPTRLPHAPMPTGPQPSDQEPPPF